MDESAAKLELFKAAVNGDLEYIRNLDGVDFSGYAFTFDIPVRPLVCLCNVRFETFRASSEEMLNLYGESVRTGKCEHFEGRKLAPLNLAEAHQLRNDITKEDDYEWNLLLLSESHNLDYVAGLTILQVAVKFQHLELVSWLLDNSEVDSNKATKRTKESPIGLAVQTNNVPLLQLMLEKGGSIDSVSPNMNTLVYSAVSADCPDTLHSLIAQGANVNQHGLGFETPIAEAVHAGKVECVKALLKAGVDTRKQRGDDEPVLCVAIRRHPEIARLIIESGIADLNEGNGGDYDCIPLFQAIHVDHLELVRLLLQHGGDPDVCVSEGHTALHLAVFGGMLHMIKVLVEFGADVNKVNDFLYAPLHHAAWDGKLEMCKILLEAGAIHDRQTKDKNTPLALACHGNSTETMKLLMQYNCDVNNQDKDLDTPIHYTTFNGNFEATKLLLEQGANPDVENSYSATPLWNAVYAGHKELVICLLKRNVRVGVKSRGINQHSQSINVMPIYHDKKSPLYVACDRGLGSETVVQLIGLFRLAGLDFQEENWLFQGNFPRGLFADIDLEGEQRIREELSKLMHTTLSLRDSCRVFFRRYFGQRLEESVNYFEVPYTLRDYLLLKDL